MQSEQDGVHYYNSGGWIDSRLTYITVAEDGVRIHEYRETDDPEGNEQSDQADGAPNEAIEESELLDFVEYEGVNL